MQTHLLIEGKFVEGEGDALEILDPATGKVLTAVREASADQIQAATASSQIAFDNYRLATPEMPWAAMKGSGTGCDMSVYALDAYTAIRHVMVAH